MGHRTLSLGLVFRALFLDGKAFEELRDDDNPFVEGLFLLILMGLATGVLNLVGQVLAWASMPRMSAIKEVVLATLQQQSWWAQLSQLSGFTDTFQRWYDIGWQVFPALFGAPDPTRGMLNIVAWPILLVLSWLIYGLLAHGFARLFGGHGTLNQMLGASALAFTPWLFRGLGFVPFLAIGAVLSTWQLILRYKAVRTVHALSWGRAFWVTLLPFAIYLVFWLVVAGIAATVIAAFVVRG